MLLVHLMNSFYVSVLEINIHYWYTWFEMNGLGMCVPSFSELCVGCLLMQVHSRMRSALACVRCNLGCGGVMAFLAVKSRVNLFSVTEACIAISNPVLPILWKCAEMNSSKLYFEVSEGFQISVQALRSTLTELLTLGFYSGIR